MAKEQDDDLVEEEGGEESQPADLGSAPPRKSFDLKKLLKHKDAPKWGAGIGLGLVLVIVVLFVTGMFSCEEKKKPKPKPAPPPTQPPPQNKPGTAGAKLGDGKTGAKPAAPKNKEPEKPKRPEKVEDWKKNDYVTAREERDRKLVEAVKQMGIRFAGKPSAARLLANLLATPQPPKVEEPPKPEPGKPQPQPKPPIPPPNPGETKTLVEAIVAALSANDTDESRQCLEQLVAGTLPCEDEKSGAEAALKALAANPSPANEEFLFRALTVPETLRKEAKPGWTPDQLRAATLTLVKPIASDTFRCNLAKFLLDPANHRLPDDPMGEFLRAETPINLSAQAALYQSPDTRNEGRAKYEAFFTRCSSGTLAQLLDIPLTGAQALPQPATGDRPSTEKPFDRDCRLVSALWSPQFVAFLEPRVHDIKTITQERPALVLAATIPSPKLRTTIFHLLRNRWDDGPEGIRTAGLMDRVCIDPGLVVSVKGLDRREPKPPKQPLVPKTPKTPRTGHTTTKSGAGKTGGNKAGAASAKAAAAAKAAEEKVKLENDWFLASVLFVEGACKRFALAADVQERAARLKGHGLRTGDAPAVPSEFQLHPNAKVTAAYHKNWPADLPPALGGAKLGPLQIHYLRIEEKGRPAELIRYYRGQMKTAETHSVEKEKCIWMESKREISGTDRVRSMDLVIHRAEELKGKNEELDDRNETDLILEILSIELNDPTD